MKRSKNVFKGWVLIIFSLFVFGCSLGQVNKTVYDQKTLEAYVAFDIKPVFNATGHPVPDEALKILTEQLQIQFQKNHIKTVTSQESHEEGIDIRSELLDYVGCEISNVSGQLTQTPTRQSMGTLQTRVVEKKTGEILAVITTTKEVPGCTLNLHQHQYLLEELARDVANQLGKLVHRTKND